jgi:hypothetical protein
MLAERQLSLVLWLFAKTPWLMRGKQEIARRKTKLHRND